MEIGQRACYALFCSGIFVLFAGISIQSGLVFAAEPIDRYQEVIKDVKKEVKVKEKPVMAQSDTVMLPSIQIKTTPIVTYMEGIPLDMPSTTGSRLGITIQEIPGSVDVVTSKTMEERGYTTTLQAVESAPGVTTGICFGVPCFSMRGFSDVTSLPILIDGNRYPGLAVAPRSTFNYEHIEIIKGASSMLHGLGSVIGSVNFVTKRADGVPRHQIEAGYGSWGKWRFAGGSGGKITDRIAYRLDVNYATANRGSLGFVDRTRYNDLHVSGEVAMDITNNLQARLAIDTFLEHGEGYFGTPLVNGKIDKRIIRNNYNVDDDRMDKDVTWVRLNFDWKPVDGLLLRNESYMNIENREWKNAEVYTFNTATGQVDRGDFLRIDHDQHIFGNRSEASLEHAFFGMSNRMLAGVEYYFNHQQRNNNAPFGGGDAVNFVRPTPGSFSSPDPFSPQRRTGIGSAGLYAENLLKLTESIKLALGYRHDISHVKSFDLRNLANDFQKTYHGDSWRVGVLYDLLPTLTFYGQWSGAAEPPAQIVTLTTANRDFNLTKSMQWEIGLKGSFWDNRVQTTLAFFDLSRRNMLTRDTSNPNTVQQIGKQSSYGIEFALGYRPNRQWSFDGNFAWTDAQYDKFSDRVSGAGVSRKGNRPNDVPEITANIWTFYRPFDPLSIGFGIRYVGDRFANRANTIVMQDYVNVNAVISYRTRLGEFALHGRNLNNAVYANRSYNDGGQVLLGEPRALELVWRKHF